MQGQRVIFRLLCPTQDAYSIAAQMSPSRLKHREPSSIERTNAEVKILAAAGDSAVYRHDAPLIVEEQGEREGETKKMAMENVVDD